MFDDCSKSLETLPIENERNTDTDTSESPSASDTVEVCLEIWLCITSALHWNIVIDDHRDCRNIETTSKDVGGNENLRNSITELLDNSITICSIESSVNRTDFVASIAQCAVEFICCAALLRIGQYEEGNLASLYRRTLTKIIDEPIVSMP